MTPWKDYSQFSSAFLRDHHQLVLYNLFHHIQAFLLFPPYCECKDVCLCSQKRKEVLLSLNVAFYNKMCLENQMPDYLRAIKAIMNIPEDHTFRENQGTVFPLWLIEEEFKKRSESNSFKAVEQFVITLLRLARTYEIIIHEPMASFNEAIDIILGKLPLHSKLAEKNAHRLGGKEAYRRQFKIHKSVCHFIAALGALSQEKGKEHLLHKDFLSFTPEDIERFLRLSHWFRKKLLDFQTRNIKNKSFFTEESLLSLPSWVTSEEEDLSLDVYQEKIEELFAPFFEHLKRIP